MRYLVGFTGILAAIALGSPDMVVLGFFLIVPGLILMIAPTVFPYLLTTAILRKAFGGRGWLKATLPAFGVSLVLGWAVMQPFRWWEKRRYEAALQPEATPSEPLTLNGDVALEWQAWPPRSAPKSPVCGHLCAALLDTPGVTSVTVSAGEARRRYRLVPAGGPDDLGLRPDNPGEILKTIQRLDRRLGGKAAAGSAIARHELMQRQQAALNAAWALRLGSRDALAADDAEPEAQFDWTIRRTVERSKGDPRVELVEALDRAGEARLRATLVEHEVPARVFRFDFHGGMPGSRFTLGGNRFSNREKYFELDAEVELLLHSNIRRPERQDDAMGALRRAAAAVLDDPYAGPGKLAMARDWLGLLEKEMGEEDEALMQRIVEDLRIRDLAPTLEERYPESPPAGFRHGLARRVLDPETPREAREAYAEMLAEMPDGTFARPTAEERAIWADPELRGETAPFVARMADQGKEGLQPLLEALEAAVAIEPWHARRHLIEGVREGLERMGEEASPALPFVRTLFNQRRSPIRNSAKDSDAWRVTMARMGMTVDELPFPPNLTAEALEKRKERIRRALRQ